MTVDTPLRTTTILGTEPRVELIRERCRCPEGEACPDGGLFAQVCPRRPHDDEALRRIKGEET